MTGNVIDFDAFRAEQAKEPLLLKIGGTTYELPPSLPASVAIETIALQRQVGNGGDVPVETLARIGAAIFGDGWDAVLTTHHITLAELPKLVTMVLEAYAAASGNAGAATDPQPASTSRKKTRGSR